MRGGIRVNLHQKWFVQTRPGLILWVRHGLHKLGLGYHFEINTVCANQ
jgi:hypothetical protein